MSQDDRSDIPDQGVLTTTRRYRAVHDLILDYALGAAIIGLNPVPALFLVTLILVSFLLLKLRHDIGKMWRFPRQRRFWVVIDTLLGVVGALSMAFMAWLTFIILSAFIPLMHRFAIAASFFTLVWMVGFAINHSYLGSYSTSAELEDSSRG